MSFQSIVAVSECGGTEQMSDSVKIQGAAPSGTFHYAPQPNCRFNADANTGHAFGIFMASIGTLRASRSGAG